MSKVFFVVRSTKVSDCLSLSLKAHPIAMILNLGETCEAGQGQAKIYHRRFARETSFESCIFLEFETKI